ncbi:MAG: hypothetical protein A4E38_00060 [Methanoregulaceae archaeon PtaB.Bin108]|nr:MAG: hypothetical protein A4E38_00060 [Methanoregulaceae archaeon PtaB.Bin108]
MPRKETSGYSEASCAVAFVYAKLAVMTSTGRFELSFFRSASIVPYSSEVNSNVSNVRFSCAVESPREALSTNERSPFSPPYTMMTIGGAGSFGMVRNRAEPTSIPARTAAARMRRERLFMP